MAIGFSIIGLSQEFWQVIVGVLVCGLGVGLLIPNANLWVISLVPSQVRGKYIGILTTATFMGMFLSPIIIQPVQELVGIKAGFIVLGIVLALLSVLYYWIKLKTLKISIKQNY